MLQIEWIGQYKENTATYWKRLLRQAKNKMISERKQLFKKEESGIKSRGEEEKKDGEKTRRRERREERGEWRVERGERRDERRGDEL